MAEKVYRTLSSSGRAQRFFRQIWYAISHDRVGMIGFVILAVIVVLSVISPAVFPAHTSDLPAAG